MTSDEMIMQALENEYIIVDIKLGKVYGCRGSSGIRLDVPRELGWLHVDGYMRMNLTLDGEKKIVPLHRVVYMAAYGEIPEGMVIDHVNNDKTDNRIINLQLMTPSGNSRKVWLDGLQSASVSPELRRRIAYEYATGTETYREIAERYGTTEDVVYKAIVSESKSSYVFTDDGPLYKPIPRTGRKERRSRKEAA